MDLITEQLREAEATEQASLSLIEGHLRGIPPGPYRTALRRHHDETRRHAQQVAERLQSLGAARSPFDTVITLGEAVVGRMTGLALAPVHLLTARARPETLLRNVFDDIAAEAREVALYEALERLADVAGDTATAALARAIRADEQRQLAALRDVLRPLADRVARERIGERPPQPEARREEAAPRPPSRANGGPVTTRTERETPHHDRAERLREARRGAPRTPEGPTRAQAARLREREREAEAPVESEGAAAPGAELRVEAPWEGYDEMKASEVIERLGQAPPAVRAMARLYEETHKARKSILAAPRADPASAGVAGSRWRGPRGRCCPV